jgi:hypothetical protein
LRGAGAAWVTLGQHMFQKYTAWVTALPGAACMRVHDQPPAGAAVVYACGVGHCMFLKYVVIDVAWVTVPPVGGACMPPAGADAAVCACT